MIKRLKLYQDVKNNIFYELTENTNNLRPFVVYRKCLNDSQPIWHPFTKNYFYKGACLNAFKKDINIDLLVEK